MRTLFLASAAILFSLKALGGSFTAPGYLLGTTITLLIGATIVSFLFGNERPVARQKIHDVAPKKRKVFIFLFLALATAGIGIRAWKIHTTPPNISESDMVPMVLAGLEAICDGKSPYFPRVLEGGRLQEGYYLPGIWMIYLPFYLVGIDIRYMNLLPHLLLYFLLLRLFLRQKQFIHSFETAAFWLLALLGLHAFSKHLVTQTLVGHTALFATTYILFLWGVREKRRRLLLIVIPLLVISREIAMFLVIPYAIWVLLNERKLFWTHLKWFVAIAALINIPFLLASGDRFFDQTRVYLRDGKVNPAEVMFRYYGLVGFLKERGLMALQPFFQLLGTGGASLFVFRSPSISPESAVALGGLGFLSFILFAAATWGYLFIEPLVLCYFLFSLSTDENRPPAK